MKLITAQTLANEAAAKWQRQFCNNGKWDHPWKTSWCEADGVHRPHYDTHKLLVALGETPDPEAVARLINNGWVTPPACSECNEESDAVVEFGEPLSYESEGAYVCLACLNAAVEIASASTNS